MCRPLAEPVTDTVPMSSGSTPRMLICVCGLASGVFGAGEIAMRSLGVAAPAMVVVPSAATVPRTASAETSPAREHPP